MSVKSYSITQFIYSHLKNYKFYVISLLLIGFIWAMINTLVPYTLKVIIDKVVKSDQNFSFSLIKHDIAMYIGLWVVFCIVIRLLDLTKLKLFPSLRKDIITNMFSYLQSHSHNYFQNNFAGSLNNKILDMQNGIVQIITIIDDIYAQFIALIIIFTTLLFIHPFFAFILIAWVISFIGITLCFLKTISNLSTIFAESRSSIVGKMVDILSNITNVRLFVRHAFEDKYIEKEVEDTCQKDRNMQAKIIWMRIVWDISIVLFIGLNITLLGIMYKNGSVTVGDFSFIMSLSLSFLWNLWYIAGEFVNFSEQIGVCRQALTIINHQHDIIDAPNSKNLIVTSGEIEFLNVNFHYGNATYLFKNKNIIIEGGEKVGLVGFSGSGKSTFVNLILRLFELESGSIKIDKQNIHEVTQDSLRNNIILIPQDVSLFHRSLMDNIRYGNINATDEEVLIASKKAHCHEFIMELSEGYNSLVGERGVKLSGGQRQRIAIARAILKNAPILILDEATSALDSVTEKYIQESLYNLMQDKTTIVIAHRLSTLAKMDRIFVFDNGNIVENGTHVELLKLQGHYANLWNMQIDGFLPEHVKN